MNHRRTRSSAFLIGPALMLSLTSILPAAPTAPKAPNEATTRAGKEDMEVNIKGQFKGRLPLDRVVAPVTLNLDKLQDFPDDPSQKIIRAPLAFSRTEDFNRRSIVKARVPLQTWVTPLQEAPFIRMVVPRHDNVTSWAFLIMNPEGQTIFQQEETSGLPGELLWNGEDSEKGFAVVDRLYSAQLRLTDAAQKQVLVQGPSVVLPYLARTVEGSDAIEVSVARLFKPNRAQLSVEGKLLLNGLSQRIRSKGFTTVRVVLSEQKKNEFSAQREALLRRSLAESLNLPESKIGIAIAPKDTRRGDIALLQIGDAR